MMGVPSRRRGRITIHGQPSHQQFDQFMGGEGVFGASVVEILIIEADPSFLILLRHHNIGHPFWVLDLLDEACRV